MAEMQQRTSSKGAGSATDFSSNLQQDRGALDVHDVNPKINQDDFFRELDSLVGKGRMQGGCTVGYFMESLDESVKAKLEEVMKNPKVQSTRLADLLKNYGFNVTSTDVLRRHRRRLQGRDGCMCNRESR